MPRPKRCRRVADLPKCALFKPAGVPARTLEELVLPMDELEALRLADYEGLYQEQAAEKMGVSRPTFGRIVASARKTVAKALIEGCALRIEGGEITMSETRTFECNDCHHRWEVPFGTGRPPMCPSCQSANFTRVADDENGLSGGRRCRHRHRGASSSTTTAPGAQTTANPGVRCRRRRRQGAGALASVLIVTSPADQSPSSLEKEEESD